MKIRLRKVFAPEKIILCFLIIVSLAQAHAAMMTYSNESTFISAAPIASTEDFEGFPDGDFRFGYSTIDVDGVIYNATTGGDWTVPGAWGGVSNSKGLGSTFGGPNEITFGTGVYVKAFGFYFISGLGAQYPWEIEVFEKGGSSTLFEVRFASNESEQYYGFLSDIGIEKIIVRDYSGDCCSTNWNYDNVSRSSPVPVIVPTDYSTIQGAVDAAQSDTNPGAVIINSNATFDEFVNISKSITIMAGEGFAPVIEKTTGYFSPIRIRALEDSDTEIVLKGITVRAYGGPGPPESNVNQCISVSNDSENHTLAVTIDNVTVEGDQVQNAITVASASINSDITFTLKNSSIQLIGESAGSPSCVRLHPYAYNLTSIIDKNTLRFSNASGIDIIGGRDDKTNTTVIVNNLFEGFTSVSGEPRAGIDISGTGSDGSFASPTQTSIANNLFSNNSTAVDANGQQSHTHTIKIYNNSIFGNKAFGFYFAAFASSTIDATAQNNIITGTGGESWGGYGIYCQVSSGGTVNLTNDYNILFDNDSGDYFGATAGANSLTDNPKFVDPESGNFHIKKDSPAIDSGICGKWTLIPRPFPQPPIIVYTRIAPYEDFEGDPRPGLNLITGCDIGADEYIEDPFPWELFIPALIKKK